MQNAYFIIFTSNDSNSVCWAICSYIKNILNEYSIGYLSEQFQFHYIVTIP